VAIHILLRGPSCRKNGIASIGICIGDAEKDAVLFKGRYDCKPLDYQTADETTNIPRELERNAIDHATQIHSFRKLLDEWEKTHDLYITCRNPAKTVGAIDRYLESEELLALRFPPRKAVRGDRPIHDIDSFARGIFKFGPDKQYFDLDVFFEKYDQAPDNNYPDQWAEYFYRVQVALNKRIKK